ncbi:MAG: tRNA (guanosine(46)-N7)-methyltransferase TrmB [Eubacteriaceae bacterium]|jgi:tRNA (guanine-N7-)-methyltransferase|nr:tRNA (guanosine(46)-N7)-methyltransferase TrmB [Eubacteriaceae bacterium]
MHIRPKPWAKQELKEARFFMDEPKLYYNRWQEAFDATRPMYLELGCGKGSFIAWIARQFPQYNFLAIDLIDAMLGLTKRKIEETCGKHPGNVRLTAYDITRISDILGEGDPIEGIYIHFCNPWPKTRTWKKRLTHPRQLVQYKTFLKPGGFIRFKTDNPDLYAVSKKYFREESFALSFDCDDLYRFLEDTPTGHPFEHNIATEHETMFHHQGMAIHAVEAIKQ